MFVEIVSWNFLEISFFQLFSSNTKNQMEVNVYTYKDFTSYLLLIAQSGENRRRKKVEQISTKIGGDSPFYGKFLTVK